MTHPPFPSPDRPAWLHWLDQCASTNSWAIDRFASLSHGDVVFTRQQTAGRGQQNRKWHAPSGVLTASFVLRSIPAAQLPSLSLAAGLAVIYAIEDLSTDLQGSLRLKWANDVLWQEQKLAGILCESVTAADSQISDSQVVVGIGLNRWVDLTPLDRPSLETGWMQEAISLHQITAIVPDELALLTRLRHYLLETAGLLQWSTSALLKLLPALRQRDALRGKLITVEQAGEQIRGEAVGLGDRGELLLRDAEGRMRSLRSGHISCWRD
jgi:BirA family transcriptional regulator, biotin operon repressor / biotin---[acetyl-CoA-carboxylase] ligase